MIDILLAVYNGQKYIQQQLDSILRQTYKNWHLIIYDDGSVDDTPYIIKDYLLRYKTKMTFIRSEVNCKSPKKSFFKLLNTSKSSYFAFCDQDDVWDKQKLELTLNLMLDMESRYKSVPILIYTDLFVVDENLNVLKKSMIKSLKLGYKEKSLSQLIVQNNITGCTILANKKLLDISNNIPDAALMHDWWLGLLAICFGRVKFLKKKRYFTGSMI